VGDVAGAENAGGEADEGVEHDEDDVQIVDQHIRPRRRAVDDEQRQRGKKGRKTRDDVQTGGQPIAGQHRQQRGRADRDQEHRRERIE
jgi:hypothetical protein